LEKKTRAYAVNAEQAPPGWQQYLDLKRRHQDELLLIRIGDFYEAYSTSLGEDAHRLADALGVQLTHRVVRGVNYGMAGIPHHVLEPYLARLVAAGIRVAIADQMEDPATVKGRPVERAVARILSAGTVSNDGLLAPKHTSLLAALAKVGGRYGIAYADVSTGEFACLELDGDPAQQEADLVAELSRLEPVELLLPADEAAPPLPNPPVLTPRPRERFLGSDLGRARLLRHFGVTTLHGLDLAETPAARVAAEVILDYLIEMSPGRPPQLEPPRRYSLAGKMVLDPQTRRSLELFANVDGRAEASLLALLDLTVSAPGGRLLRRWLAQPLTELGPLRARQAQVASLHDNRSLRVQLRQALAQTGDLERACQRLAAGMLTPRQAASLIRHLEAAQRARSLFAQAPATAPAEPTAELPDLEPLALRLAAALVADPPATFAEGGVIRPAYDTELGELTRQARRDREWLLALESRERERTGIKSLKLGWNAVFGYYLEVTRPNLHLVPDEYHRRSTVANAERFTTAELLDHERCLRESSGRIAAYEQALYGRLLADASTYAPALRRLAVGLAELDALAALAEVAVERGYVRPELDDGYVLSIEGGRHPLVEVATDDFVANDVLLEQSTSRCAILFGPNMGGKSTYLRMVALVVLMAQIGSFVPARNAHIGLVDRVFTRIGAHDDLARGRSTFLVEMEELATIRHCCTPRSLALLDEVGRGTSTADGLAICQAVVEYLHNHPLRRPRTLIATHFHELADFAERLPAVKALRVTVAEDGDRVVFLHKVEPGASDCAYGIHVAQMAGLPGEVLLRAKELLDDARPGQTPSPVVEQSPEGLAHPQVKEGARQHTFAAPPRPVEPGDNLLRELREPNLANLTPLAALNLLARWRDEADRSPDGST